jgi:hypothetical protein
MPPKPTVRSPSSTRPAICAHRGAVLGAPGGLVADRMIGCSVTTLTRIEKIQKHEKRATFWMIGIGAIVTRKSPAASFKMDTIAGGKRCEYDSTIAVCRSCVRWYSS